jgi:hypothetical protein
MASMGTTVNTMTHPMQAASEMISKVNPMSEFGPQKMSLFQSATEGPAEIAAKTAGVMEGSMAPLYRRVLTVRKEERRRVIPDK